MQVALLTIYDMCKAVDRGMVIETCAPGGEIRWQIRPLAAQRLPDA